METTYDAHIMPVYLQYDRLTAKTLGRLLNELGGMADFVSETYARHHLTRMPLPTLEVETICTGESIKLTFGEGWFPSVSMDKNNDIVINTPKKLGIPLLVGYLLIGAAEKALKLHNDFLDGHLKHIELELKQMELELKQHEIKKDLKMDSVLIPELIPQATNTVRALVQNTDITVLRIYDINIINRKKDRGLRHHRK
jgi:hypothetical protein